jgi:hypothetical protein
MSRVLLCIVATVCVASFNTLHAEDLTRASSIFSRQALQRALPPLSEAGLPQLDPWTNWTAVHHLPPSTEIILTRRGTSTRKCRVLSVNDVSLTVVDLEAAGQPTVRVARDEVVQIARWVGPRGSKKGAIAGAAGGFLLGFVTSVGLANKQCGTSCGDEQLLMAVSLVGMPIGGMILGYGVSPSMGRRELETVYVAP